MWGELELVSQSGKKTFSIPQTIEFDVSKFVHFIGRVPNPPNTFSHKSQHIVSIPFLSSTHCSVSTAIENDLRVFHVTDFSTNGTYLSESCSPSDHMMKLDNNIPTPIVNGMFIIFKYLDDSYIVYKFKVASISQLTPLVSVGTSGPEGSHLANQLTAMQFEMKIVTERLEEANSSLSQQEATIFRRESELKSLELEASALREEVSAAAARLEDCGRQLREAECRVTDATRREAEVSAKLHEHQNNIQRLQQELSYKSEQVARRDEIIRDCNSQISEHCDSLAKFHEKVNSLEVMLKESNASAEYLGAASSALQIRLSDREVAIREREACIDHLVSTLEVLHRRLEQREDEMKDWQSKLQYLLLTIGASASENITTDSSLAVSKARAVLCDTSQHGELQEVLIDVAKRQSSTDSCRPLDDTQHSDPTGTPTALGKCIDKNLTFDIGDPSIDLGFTQIPVCHDEEGGAEELQPLSQLEDSRYQDDINPRLDTSDKEHFIPEDTTPTRNNKSSSKRSRCSSDASEYELTTGLCLSHSPVQGATKHARSGIDAFLPADGCSDGQLNDDETQLSDADPGGASDLEEQAQPQSRCNSSLSMN